MFGNWAPIQPTECTSASERSREVCRSGRRHRLCICIIETHPILSHPAAKSDPDPQWLSKSIFLPVFVCIRRCRATRGNTRDQNIKYKVCKFWNWALTSWEEVKQGSDNSSVGLRWTPPVSVCTRCWTDTNYFHTLFPAFVFMYQWSNWAWIPQAASRWVNTTESVSVLIKTMSILTV